MIFFNIGWMDYYKGMEGDDIVGGGSFVEQEHYGHEIFNFLPENGYMYGYVQPVHNTINIERIGASSKEEFIENVLSVWIAKGASGGTYIIGWYDNATIFRNLQKKPSSETIRILNNEVFGYYAKAKEKDCTLLLSNKRSLKIPRGKGGIGQSNVWYADKEYNIKLKEEVLEFVEVNKTRMHIQDIK